MTDQGFEQVLKRMMERELKVTILLVGSETPYVGYIVEVAEEYIHLRCTWNENSYDAYLRISFIRLVSPNWLE